MKKIINYLVKYPTKLRDKLAILLLKLNLIFISQTSILNNI